jgi:predicted dehydrogenase
VNDPLRVGLVGTGKIAINHAAALRSIPGVEPAGVTDLDPGRAEAFATRFGVAEHHRDLESLPSSRLDAVTEYPEGTPGRNDVWTVKGEKAYEHVLSTTVDADPPLSRIHEGLVQFHRSQIDEFFDDVRPDRDPAMTGRDARNALAVVLAIYQSSRTGEPVNVT